MIQQINYKVEGNTIATIECGDKSHPIALFIHGIPANALLWEETMIKVAQSGYYCIAPYCPGYGATEVLSDELYSLKNSATLLNTWLKQQSFSNIWLIAHDIGGGIAQIMVTQEQKLFSKMSLSNCITASTWPVISIKMMIATAKLKLFPLVAASGMMQLIGGVDLKKAFKNQKQLTKKRISNIFFDSKITTSEGRMKFAKLLSALSSKDTEENMKALSQIELPVHLVWAMNDPFQPWNSPGKILQQTFKNVSVDKINNCGHFLQLDDTNAYVEMLLRK